MSEEKIRPEILELVRLGDAFGSTVIPKGDKGAVREILLAQLAQSKMRAQKEREQGQIMTEITKDLIRDYLAKNETKNAEVLLQILDADFDIYSRKNPIGHITGSAWILDDTLENVLLIEHGKYKIFVPPGGHVDPNESPEQAASREAGEEVGLLSLILLSEAIFDIDIHEIPSSEKKQEPAHWHADIRFAYRNPPGNVVNLNEEECLDHKWTALEDLIYRTDFSIKRMAEKTLALREQWGPAKPQ